MLKIIGKLIGLIINIAVGYAICYFGWLPTIINWVKGLLSQLSV